MKHTVDDYTILGEIGRGTYSIVYKAEHSKTGKIVALKQIQNISAKDLALVQNEIQVLRKVKHKNIVGFQGDFKFKGKRYLIFQHCAQGDLYHYLHQHSPLKQPTVQMAGWCICSALLQLHCQNIVHRDLKLANILLTQNLELRLADFGFSKQTQIGLMKTYCGSPITMAPEVLQNRSYRDNCDTWSLGVIVYQMVSGGRAPWMPEVGGGPAGLANAIKMRPLAFSEDFEVSEGCKRFLRRCLNKDAVMRPSIKEILEDPWLVEGERMTKQVKHVFQPQLCLLQDPPQIISQSSLQQPTHRSLQQTFRYPLQQHYIQLLRRYSLNKPKSLFKQVQDQFSSETPLLTLLPLLLLLKIRAIAEKKVTFVFGNRKVEVRIGSCRDFEKRHTDIVSSIRKLINREKASAYGKVNIEKAVMKDVINLVIVTLDSPLPVECIRTKLRCLGEVVELFAPEAQSLVIGIEPVGEDREEMTKKLEAMSQEKIIAALNTQSNVSEEMQVFLRGFRFEVGGERGEGNQGDGSRVRQQHEYEMLKLIIEANLRTCEFE